MTNADVDGFAHAFGFPNGHDPEFWPKCAALIDDQIEEHKHALKNWWLVRKVPFWYPGWSSIELNFLIALQEYYKHATPEKQARLRKGLAEPYLGHTSESYEESTFDFGNGVLTGSWPLKNAHHIMKWEQHSGRDLTEYDHVIEIGAGLGDLPRYCYDIGFAGTYTVLDLPPTSKIQQAYLNGLYPVKWVHDVTRIVPQPNTLVIATWSLSEIGYAERTTICKALEGLDWFVIFQCSVQGFNNVGWFPKFFAKATQTKVTYEAMPFHPFQGGSFYAYGQPGA